MSSGRTTNHPAQAAGADGDIGNRLLYTQQLKITPLFVECCKEWHVTSEPETHPNLKFSAKRGNLRIGAVRTAKTEIMTQQSQVNIHASLHASTRKQNHIFGT